MVVRGYTYTYIYIHVYIYIHMNTYNTCIFTYICMYMDIYVHKDVFCMSFEVQASIQNSNGQTPWCELTSGGDPEPSFVCAGSLFLAIQILTLIILK